MKALKLLPALAAIACLAACEAKIGKDADKTTAAAAGSHEKAGEGSFSIDAPGFDMKVDIPDALAAKAHFDSDSGLVYPGAKLSGLHVDASDDTSSNGVEIVFTSADALATVAGWYRDPARADDFAVTSAVRQGDALVITGTEKEDSDPFTLRLSPHAGGGSEGRLTLRDRS